jgi:hypothetical protein
MKNLFYLTAVIIALTFTACNSSQNESIVKADSIQQDPVQKPIPVLKLSESFASVCFDLFTGMAAGSTKHHFSNFIREEAGFDIYYARAEVFLNEETDAKMNPNPTSLKITFNLPPALPFGNWLSLRKNFQEPQNLEGYSGIIVKLKVKAIKPGAILRITLADIAEYNSENDELWWFNLDKNLLKTVSGNWIEIKMPFDSAKISYGEGVRHNNGKFDLDKIVAYEFNLVSGEKKHPAGTLIIQSICTYK